MASRPDAMTGLAPTASLSPSRKLWGGLILIGVLQLAWLAWILGEPLPNAGNSGGKIARSTLLWQFIPEVVPGLTWQQSYLGNAVDQLSHVENLPQRLPIVAAAGLILLSAVSLGRLLIHRTGLAGSLHRSESVALAYGLGMSALGWITQVVGRAGLISPWAIRVGLLVPIIADAWLTMARDRKSREGQTAPFPSDPPLWRWSVPTLLLVVVPFVLVMALGAMLPTIDFDAIAYHLEGPKEYFRAGRIAFLPHNVYTSMPFSVEMLHLLGMEVWNDWWWGALTGQLLVASFAPMAGLMIWCAARRWCSPRAAWVATAVYLTTPWIYRMAAIPYVEGPLCYYHAALIWATGRAWAAPDEFRTRFWGVTGALAGGAMAIKYPGLVSAVIPFGLAALAAGWRARSPRLVLAYGLGVAVVMAPWMVKNVVDTGNPVYPLGYRVFGGTHWDAQQDAKWANAHGPRPISVKAFVDSALEVAGRSDWQSPAFTALVPLSLLNFRRRPMVLALMAFVAYVFLTWWLLTHRLDRFWLPLVPALSLLAGLGADWGRSRVWSIMLGFVLFVSVLTNGIYSSTALAGLNDWTGDLKELRSSVPRMINAPLAALDAGLPPGAKPLLVGQAAVFHMDRPAVYNTVFNKETIEELTRGRSNAEIIEAFLNLGITHVYVDWFEIGRYRSPGNYGYTDYVTPELFKRWVDAGLLLPPVPIGRGQELYEIRTVNW